MTAHSTMFIGGVVQSSRQQGLTQSREVLKFLADIFHYHTSQVSHTIQINDTTTVTAAAEPAQREKRRLWAQSKPVPSWEFRNTRLEGRR